VNELIFFFSLKFASSRMIGLYFLSSFLVSLGSKENKNKNSEMTEPSLNALCKRPFLSSLSFFFLRAYISPIVKFFFIY